MGHMTRAARKDVENMEQQDAQHRAEMCKMLSERVIELEKVVSELSEALGYAHAQVGALRKALNDVEWACDDRYCPACGGYPEQGHNMWCDLGAALESSHD